LSLVDTGGSLSKELSLLDMGDNRLFCIIGFSLSNELSLLLGLILLRTTTPRRSSKKSCKEEDSKLSLPETLLASLPDPLM
jgi:hypothetical protein